MSLLLSGDLRLRKTWQPMDPDAAAYITAVETADDQALEQKTKIAIDNFVLGCKADGIWDAIKASCILAGARTRLGALTPLKGTAPTSFNFVDGDYNRKTGLVGNASTKYLDSNRAANADPQNNFSISAYISAKGDVGWRLFGAYSGISTADDFIDTGGDLRCRSIDTPSNVIINPGLAGFSRASSTAFTVRSNGTNVTGLTGTSVAPGARSIFVFAQNDIGNPFRHSNARLAFYSIGESLNLALLDARVTDLINAFGAAIP